MDTVKIGEVLSDSFPVTTRKGEPVKGLLDKEFKKVLYGPEGAELTAEVPVTVSELGNGMYRLNFTPTKVGEWLLTVSHEKHCPWGMTGKYLAHEGEATEEAQPEEAKPTRYIIMRHWPDEATPELGEHWDIKLMNAQGHLYEWTSADDLFENADGVLGESVSCCAGEKALDLEGKIDLAPGSAWNPSAVPAHLEPVQSGQVHFVEEQPGLVIAYLDQLPFRAIQEGDTNEWDITLGVWAAMSKERYTALVAMPAETYETKDLSNMVLADDFRIATAWFATLKAGKEIDRTESEIRGFMNKIVQEIGNRGKVTFDLANMAEPSKQMMASTLWDLYGKDGKGIYEPQLHAEMIACGRKTMKLEQEAWDLKGFYGLIDGEDIIGMVRFEDRQEISEAEFAGLKDEHRTTMAELGAWGWEFPIYGWKVREYVSLANPEAMDGKTAWLREEIQLPFPNEHAARLKSPESLTPFERVTRTRGSGDGTVQGVTIPKSISVIWYVVKREGKEVPVPQTLRFPTRVWTEAEARAWLKKNKIDFMMFEPASGGNLANEDPELYAELRGLVDHAEDELRRAGLFDEDSDYGGMMAHSVLAIMKLFAKQGHSGFSAEMCKMLFQKLASFETLTPITSDPKEWNDVSEMCSGKPFWQNNRNPAMFSEDGGKTWYDVNEKDSSDDSEMTAELQEDFFRTSEDHGHRHVWAPGRSRTTTIAGHSHEIDEAKHLALETNKHTHTLLTERV